MSFSSEDQNTDLQHTQMRVLRPREGHLFKAIQSSEGTAEFTCEQWNLGSKVTSTTPSLLKGTLFEGEIKVPICDQQRCLRSQTGRPGKTPGQSHGIHGCLSRSSCQCSTIPNWKQTSCALAVGTTHLSFTSTSPETREVQAQLCGFSIHCVASYHWQTEGFLTPRLQQQMTQQHSGPIGELWRVSYSSPQCTVGHEVLIVPRHWL